MPTFFLLLLVVVFCSCQPTSQSPLPEVLTTPAIQDSQVSQPILTPNRRFVYLVRWYAPRTATPTCDTLSLTASGGPWSSDTTQTSVQWLFAVDTTLTSRPQQTVGAIETPTRFWLHPPRYEKYRILELNPFPEIRFSPTATTWTGTVYPSDGYSDPAWGTWSGVLPVQFTYSFVDSVQLVTPLGKLRCARVRATGKSKLGSTQLVSYFQAAYGFVRLEYTNLDRSRVEMEMRAVELRPVPLRGVFEKVFTHRK